MDLLSCKLNEIINKNKVDGMNQRQECIFFLSLTFGCKKNQNLNKCKNIYIHEFWVIL